jgi:ATP-dependent Clp protease ATP-binding subunit ClpC
MFQRFTEQARRVVFFARYETSFHGAVYIEAEHLLLGLIREDPTVIRRFLGPRNTVADLRAEIERQLPPGERISTSVEVPLSQESKRILQLAFDAADKIGSFSIDTEHLLLAMLCEEGSLAAKLLRKRGVTPDTVREHLAKAGGDERPVERKPEARFTVESFLAALQSGNRVQLVSFFAADARFLDAAGAPWMGRGEIETQIEHLLALYARKNVRSVIEAVHAGAGQSVVARVLFTNLPLRGRLSKGMHRMTIVLAPENDDWIISLLQVTPVVDD